MKTNDNLIFPELDCCDSCGDLPQFKTRPHTTPGHGFSEKSVSIWVACPCGLGTAPIDEHDYTHVPSQDAIYKLASIWNRTADAGGGFL